MEPRAATPEKRLDTVRRLADAGVPTVVTTGSRTIIEATPEPTLWAEKATAISRSWP